MPEQSAQPTSVLRDAPAPSDLRYRRRRADVVLPFRLWAAVGAAAGLLLSGCASTATVEAAPYAEDPDCAEVMLRLPQAIGDQERRPTGSQATAVWGEPSEIVLRCGAEPIGPTTDPCVRYGGIDWVAIDREDHWQLLSYGREPTIEVLLAMEQISSVNAMPPLADAVGQLEQLRECTSYVENEEEPAS